MTPGRRKAVAVLYYGGLCLLLALIVTKSLPHLLPATVARHIGYDSEGYVLALLLPPWIEYVRPRLTGKPFGWAVTPAAAAASLSVGLLLYNSHSIIGGVKTLNETFFALALLIPYVQLTRRLSGFAAVACAVGVLAGIVAAEYTPLATITTNLAEGTVMLLLAPLAFDLADRVILQPDRPGPQRLRRAWWVLLAVAPLAFIVLVHVHLGVPLHAAVRYATRAQEAFVGMLLLELYFAARGPRRTAAPTAGVAAADPAELAARPGPVVIA